MSMRRSAILVLAVALMLTGGLSSALAQTNSRPSASILWPNSAIWLGVPLYIKIKAEASSPGGSIAQVQFLAQTNNLIGVVTNPPFTLLWSIGRGVTNQNINPLVLNVVATDKAGLTTTSAPVIVPLSGGPPPPPVLKITSPAAAAVLAAPATFALTAELLASVGDTGPEEFFVGTNSLGVVNTNGHNDTFTLDTPPASVIVSNLTEGTYQLSVKYLGWDAGYCECDSVKISVVRLALVSPKVGPDQLLRFDVVTAFLGMQNVIELSTNLQSWTPIRTNQPSSNTFTFTNTSPSAGAARFYRVRVTN